MRKLIFGAFIVFWSVLATLLLLHALTPASRPSEVASTEARDTSGESVEPAMPRRYSLQEVGEHAHLSDCWMAIEGNVYDLTEYIPRHPASEDVLEPWCGRDATTGMRTKGKDRDHSARAWRMLERYRIGELKSK